MGLFDKKEKKDAKKESGKVDAKQLTADSRMNESKININKFQFNKDDVGRRIQLTAFMHMLKLDLGHKSFSELTKRNADGETESLMIPYSFNLYETICLAIHNQVDSWYVDINEDNCMEAFFDTVQIKGNPMFTDLVNQVFRQAEHFSTNFPIFSYDYKTGPWQWEKLRQNQYQVCLRIGDSIFKNGSFVVYPKDDTEIIIYQESDYRLTEKDNIEYVVLRSNLQADKVLLIDNVRRVALGMGFDELETEELKNFLNPSKMIGQSY